MARTVTVTFKGQDQLTSTLSNISKYFDKLGKTTGTASASAPKAAGAFSRLGSALGNVAQIAGGIVAANILGKIGQGLQAFVAGGLAAVGEAQKLETSLNALFTANMMYERSTEQVTTAVQKSAEQIANEEQKLASLRAERDLQIARLNEQKQKVWEMTNVWSEEGLATQTAKAQLAKMEQQVSKTNSKIAELENSTVEYTTSTIQGYKQVRGMADAQALARDATKELRAEIDKISVISPFEAQQVEAVAKYAVQAGMGVKQTKNFTAGFLDLAAAVGITSADLGFAADQLLQVKKMGKLTQIDLRQLRRLGIDLGKVIGVEMGMSIDEFNKAAEKSPEIFDDLFQAVTDFSANTFAGSAEQFSRSVPGMISQAKDLFQIGARDFFTPIVEAVSPTVQATLDKMGDLFLGGDMAAIGEGIAELISAGMGAFSGDQFAVFDFIQGLTNLGFDTQSVVAFTDAFTTLSEVIGRIKAAFEEGGLQGLLSELGVIFSEGWATYVQPVLDEWVDKATAWVLQAIPKIPEYLNQFMESLLSFLTEQAPKLQESTAEWIDTIFAWVNEATNRVGQFMAVLLVAIGAWVASGEAQGKLTEIGQAIGRLVATAIATNFEDQGQMLMVMGKIAAGLAAAVGALAGMLIVVGGQIVAGILSGILESLGVNLKPAMFSELGAILSGIAANAMTIAKVVGTDIVVGILTGINDMIAQLTTTIQQIGFIILQTIKETLGIASPSTVFAAIGGDIIAGLIQGIQENIGTVMETIGNLFSMLFGGGDEDSQMLDFSGLIADLVTNIPEAITILLEAFTNLWTVVTTQIRELVMAGTLVPLKNFLILLYSETLMILQDTWTTMSELMAAGIEMVIAAVRRLIAVLNELVKVAQNTAKKVVEAMEDVGDSFEDIAEIMETELIPAIKEAEEAYRKMAEAAKDAASSGEAAAANSPGGGAEGQQHGGHIFPGNSYLVGEAGPELITPTRQAFVNPMEDGAGRGGDTYILQIYTSAPTENIIEDFATLKAMGSSAA